MRLEHFILLALALSCVTWIVSAERPNWYSRKAKRHPLEDKAVLTPKEKENIKADEPGPDYRLPTSLVPQHYLIRIRPIIDRDHPGIGDKDTARGLVRVTVKCVESTSRIVMHQKFLQVNDSFISVKQVDSGEEISVSGVEYDEPRDFMMINLAKELEEGNNYDIQMGYWARVPPNDSFRGLYSESYLDPVTNQTKVVAVTQLEPLRARQVFPSFDEPTYKATIDLIVGRTENFTSLGNAPLIDTAPDRENAGWFWDTFNTTVPMPTYLFAMAVSEYGFNEASASLYRLPVRVYGPRHLTDEGKAQLTADGSASLMNYFEQKYGIPHHMPKVDSISVPYKGGAMENYGLITYGEKLLMYHEGVTLDTELRQMFHILAHELGHQWFGNLVTCKWWSDIWLNEGFATYVSYDAVQNLWPRFDMMTFQVHDAVNDALKYDATEASHPIHEEAYNAEQIGRNMDAIGYDKGSAMVRMMVSFLGEETFYEGIREYLNTHRDSVADQDDLFEALQNAGGSTLPKTVKEIMHTWTLQKGFPLVRVTLRESDNSLVFSQEPWRNADTPTNSSSNSSWNIPVRYFVQNGQDSGQEGSLWLLQGEEGPENVTMQNGSGWILTNPDAGGYYRTLYDDVLAQRITEQLESNHEVFSAAARVRLLDDQLTSGFQNQADIRNALEFTKYLSKETDLSVWASVLSNLMKLRMFWGKYSSDDISFGDLKRYLLPRIENVTAQLGNMVAINSPEDASAQSILYAQLTDWSCALDSESCASYASQLFDEWQQNPTTNPVPHNLQSTLYCKMVEVFGESGFNFILEQYRKPDQTRVQKAKLASALGCIGYNFDDYDAIIMGLTRDGLEAADSVSLLQRLLQFNGVARQRILIYIQLVDQWMGEYGWTVQELTQVINVGADYFTTSTEVSLVFSITEVNADIYKGSLNATLKAVRDNQAWNVENNFKITSWLYSNSQ